jgi:signal peptidase I
VFVKRVIALAGDSIEVRCGVVYVNDKAVPQTRVGDRYRETLGAHSYEVREEKRADGQPDLHDFPQWDAMISPSCVQGSFYDKPTNTQPQGTIVEGKPKASASACEAQLHFVVPAKSFFVMGDNRTNANDSRYWGVVPDAAFIGRVIGVYKPWSRFGAIH